MPVLTLLVFERRGSDVCRDLSLALQELAPDFGGRIRILRTEVPDSRAAERYAIGELPTTVFYREGRAVARLEGAISPAALRAHVEFLLGQSGGGT